MYGVLKEKEHKAAHVYAFTMCDCMIAALSAWFWTRNVVLQLPLYSTAQGGGGSFKNRKPIGEVGCCESRMAEQRH